MAQKDNIYQQINQLYGKIYAYNNKLLNRSERELKEGQMFSAVDIFDFYIASHAFTFLKSMFLDSVNSVGFLLNARCLIEGLALKRMCQRGKVSKLQEELLQKQVFLLEYRCYKKNDIKDFVCHTLNETKLQTDYELTRKFYKDKLQNKYTDYEIEKICHSSIPFLCDPRLSYRKIIKEELGEETASIYGCFSALIHPNDNTYYKNVDIIDKSILLFYLIQHEYDHLPQAEYTLEKDLALICGDSEMFVDLCFQQADILDGVAEIFEQFFKNNYVSNTMRTIALLYKELSVEKCLGLTEQVKCKWKCLLELMAVFYHFYVSMLEDEGKMVLLDEHCQMQIKRNFGVKHSLDRVYEKYCAIFESSCDREQFENEFSKALGYTIDGQGRVKSLTSLAKLFVQKFENVPNMKECMILDYVESQMLSHANGYMWFANSGSFADINNIFRSTDMSMLFILDTIKTMFDVHKMIEDTQRYKPLINYVRNNKKKFEAIARRKHVFYHIKMVQKGDVY